MVLMVALSLQLLTAAMFYEQPAVLADSEEAQPACSEANAFCLTAKIAVGSEALKTVPRIQVTAPQPEVAKRVVTYIVETRGNLRSADLAEFKRQANETLNDERGWGAMGVRFEERTSGGEFTLVLSEASQVPSFAPGGCDSYYSCNVGRYVIINEDRWMGATSGWNANGGGLRDYRHMVVNHETGHWLGHGHQSCSGSGNKAAVMQQQSIDLGGCAFNPWPLPSELYSSRLGI